MMTAPPPGGSSLYSRRRFIRQLLGAGAVSLTGLDLLPAQMGTAPGVEAFRFAFVTDTHLMLDETSRSADGIGACLTAVEKLDPRPEFILVGGDLVHKARDFTISEAERSLDLFLKIWNDHTALSARWVFGNHDLVGTSNTSISSGDRHYAKGLFQDRFQLPHLYYSFEHKGWRFVILDDIALQPDRSYIGRFFDQELQFLQADLDAHRTMPTIVCAHIPTMSALPLGLLLAHAATGHNAPIPGNLVCTNADELFTDFPGHNIRAVLAGHLHHFERMERNGIPFITSGAVCGNYWQGPMYGCPEGFGVVDVGADGAVAFDYRTYGWKA